MKKPLLFFLLILTLGGFFCVYTFNSAQAGDSYETHLNIGREYLLRGSYQSAAREFSQAINQKPSTPEAFIERGTAFNQMGKYEKAIEDFSKAILHDERNFLALNNRGVAYLRLGKLEQSMQDFQRACEIAPNDPIAKLNYAGAAIPLKKGDVAALELNNWLSKDNHWKNKYAGHAAILAILGYRQCGDMDNANKVLEVSLDKVFKLDWPYPVLKYLNGKLEKDDLLESAKDSDYDTTQANCFIAVNLINAQQLKPAKERLSWIVKYGSKNSVEYWLGKNLLSKQLKKNTDTRVN